MHGVNIVFIRPIAMKTGGSSILSFPPHHAEALNLLLRPMKQS